MTFIQLSPLIESSPTESPPTHHTWLFGGRAAIGGLSRPSARTTVESPAPAAEAPVAEAEAVEVAEVAAAAVTVESSACRRLRRCLRRSRWCSFESETTSPATCLPSPGALAGTTPRAVVGNAEEAALALETEVDPANTAPPRACLSRLRWARWKESTLRGALQRHRQTTKKSGGIQSGRAQRSASKSA